MALIPTQNPKALISYYLSLASLLCFIGIIPGIIAIILGFMAIKAANLRPEIEGKGHAITGIVIGIIGCLIQCALIFFLIVGLASQPRSFN